MCCGDGYFYPFTSQYEWWTGWSQLKPIPNIPFPDLHLFSSFTDYSSTPLKNLIHKADCYLLSPTPLRFEHGNIMYTQSNSVLQQNILHCWDTHAGCGNSMIVTNGSPYPPKHVQNCAKSQHWAVTAQHCPKLSAATYVMLKQSSYKEYLIGCFSFFWLLHHISLKKKRWNAQLQLLLWTSIMLVHTESGS